MRPDYYPSATKTEQNNKKTRPRPLAWLVAFAGIPVLIILSIIWCHIFFWFVSLIESHLSGFLKDLFSDFWAESLIVTIATAVIYWFCGTWFSNKSEKIAPTRKGGRYFAVSGCCFVIAIIFTTWAIKGKIPFRLPYEPQIGVLLNVIAALVVFAVSMIRAAFKMRKEREKATAQSVHICIFCYTAKPVETSYSRPKDRGFVPFSYITGGLALINEKGTLEVPERDGLKLDIELFNEYLSYIGLEENVNNKHDWLTINAFDGYIVGNKAICNDLVQVTMGSDQWRYADLLTSPLFDKNAAAFNLDSEGQESDLKYCRHYHYDENGEIVPAFYGRTPREDYEKLLKDTKQNDHMISIMFDDSLTETEHSLVERAIRDTQKVFPMLYLENSESYADDPKKTRKNMDSFVKKTKTENGRYDAKLILDNMESLKDSMKEYRAVILFTARDLCLTTVNASWCFGAARHSINMAVTSVFRYRNLSKEDALCCIRRTLRHEIGHAVGLAADPKRVNVEQNFGLHCTSDGCTMRQAGTLEALLKQAKEEEQQKKWFCPYCKAELKAGATVKKEASKESAPEKHASKKQWTREEAITSIYRHNFSEIYGVFDQLGLKLGNVKDIRDGKYSDETLYIIAETLEQKGN